MAEDISADVIIVGSGISGALLAARARRRGREGRDPGGGRGGRSRNGGPDLLGCGHQGSGVPLPADAAGDASDLERPAFLVRAGRAGPFLQHVPKGGRRHHLALARHLPSLRAERLPAEDALRPGRGLADLLRRTRAILWPRRAGDRRIGRRGATISARPAAAAIRCPPFRRPSSTRLLRSALAGTEYQVRPTPQGRLSQDQGDRPACCGNASCIPICPVQAKYDATIHLDRATAAGATLFPETTAVFVEVGADRTVTGIRFKRWDGSEGRATGKVYRPCRARDRDAAPAAELGVRGETPNGVANSSDQVGRNLMDHPTQLSWALAGSSGLSLSRAALDLGHRKPARRRLPQAARRLPHRDRQRRLVVADRRSHHHRRPNSRCRACAAPRSTRRWPTRPRATSGSPRWWSNRPTRRTASRSAALATSMGSQCRG